MTVYAGERNEELFTRYGVEWHDYHNIHPIRRAQQLYTLRKFAIGIGPERTILDATSSDIRAWLEVKRQAGFKPGSLRLHINYFRPFFTWAHQVGLVDEDKLRDIRSIKPPRGSNSYEPRPYNRRERELFWHDFERTYPWCTAGQDTSRERGAMYLKRYLAGRSKWNRARPYCQRLQSEAIVNLAMIGGLRRIEIFNLTLEDIDPVNEYIVVHTAKKDRASDRAVPWLVATLRQSVEDWLTVRAALAPEHDRPWLFLNRIHDGEALGRTPIPLDHFVGIVARCGPWSFHRMRHTAITEMCRSGIPIQNVQRIAGHASILQTQAYMEVVADDLVEAARRAERRLTHAFGRVA